MALIHCNDDAKYSWLVKNRNYRLLFGYSLHLRNDWQYAQSHAER